MHSLTKNEWNNNKIKFLINFVALLLVALTIFLSLVLAKHQATLKEADRLESVATNIVARMKITRMQFASVLDTFHSESRTEICNPANVLKMQEMVAGGVFLKAVGHMKGTVIECSSLPGVLDGMDLGNPANIEPDGTSVWTGISIPNWKDRNFVLLQKNGIAVLIVPHNAIEALESDVISVAIFSIRSHRVFTKRGKIDHNWINKYQTNTQVTFVDHDRGMLIYIMPTETKQSAIITAVPLTEITKSTIEFSKIFLPIGCMLGLALAAIFVLIIRNRYSPKNAILKALLKDEFYMEYQPIIELRTNKCVGAEALIRWRSADGTIISPDLFVPIAEANGIIALITHRVFELVAKDMKEIFHQYPDFHIGVNISSQDLMSADLLKMLKTLLRESGANHKQIIIEATERGFLNDEKSLKIMKQIRSLGIQIAIDDFGTGYSSLSYLTKFELDYLKIDKSFVDSIGTEAVTRYVAWSIIDMAKCLNLGMVAEGVETEVQARLLYEKGVSYMQGWFFSKSLLPIDFYTFLKTNEPLSQAS
jgi:sensor c-di-GMP phosphodiesterase-like protein